MRPEPFARRALLPLLLAGGLLAGCVEVATTAPVIPPNPNPPPPPPRVETIPKPPVSEALLVWRPGEWEWAGTGYTWRAGEYVPLAGHSNQYLPGHWEAQGGVWVWVRGHWL